MFTGIIRELGTIVARQQTADGLRLTIAAPMAATITSGDSIAVNGACLTALNTAPDSWTVRLMQETLARTNLGTLKMSDQVNLERPLRADQTLDGHFVLGHVDGVATINDRTTRAGDTIFTFAPPRELLPYLIPQGSVALNGVSLTIVAVHDSAFTVSLMPYSMQHTTFNAAAVGDAVNIEVDVLAKHVARLLTVNHHAKIG